VGLGAESHPDANHYAYTHRDGYAYADPDPHTNCHALADRDVHAHTHGNARRSTHHPATDSHSRAHQPGNGASTVIDLP
jgi:hypothetical protein